MELAPPFSLSRTHSLSLSLFLYYSLSFAFMKICDYLAVLRAKMNKKLRQFYAFFPPGTPSSALSHTEMQYTKGKNGQRASPIFTYYNNNNNKNLPSLCLECGKFRRKIR